MSVVGSSVSKSKSVLDPTLYMSTVLTAGVQKTGQEMKALSPPAKRKTPCFSWYKRICKFSKNCVYLHVCLGCGGDHKVLDCPMGSAEKTPVANERRRSPSPVITKNVQND